MYIICDKMRMGYEPVPPDRPVVDSLGNIQMGRREADAWLVVLGTTIVVAGATGVKLALDNETRKTYPPGETRIDTVAETTPARSRPGRPCFVFGGLGRQSAVDIADVYAKALKDAPDPPTRFGSLYIPNQGISTDENAVCMEGFAGDDEEFDLFGHSMGYLTALRSALSMKTPRHINTITALSSPTGINDVFRKRDVEIVVQLGLDGDIGQKALFNILNEHTSDRPGWLGKVVDIGRRAWHNAHEGVSPAVYVDQLNAVYYERAYDLMGQLAARGMVDDTTKVRYFKTLQDGTVIPNQACDSCEQASLEVEAGFNPITFEGRHADVNAACEKMQREGLY